MSPFGKTETFRGCKETYKVLCQGGRWVEGKVGAGARPGWWAKFIEITQIPQ